MLVKSIGINELLPSFTEFYWVFEVFTGSESVKLGLNGPLVKLIAF